MSRFAAYVLRLATVILAYAAASLSASIVLHALYFGWPDGGAAGGSAGWIAFSLLFTGLIVAYLAFIPAMVAILLSEIFSRRAALFHALLGAAIGLIVSAALWHAGAEASSAAADPRFWLAAVLAGVVSALVYRAIAGRRAGAWLPPRRGPTSPER